MALTTACLGGAFHGIGVHSNTLNDGQRTTALKVNSCPCCNRGRLTDISQWFFLFEVFYCVCVILVKVSIALMLNRIAGNRVKFVYTNHAIMVLCVSVNLASALYIIFQCNH